MKQEIEQLKTDIETLKFELSRMKELLTSQGMDNDLRGAIRDTVFMYDDATSARTQTVAVSGDPENITVAKTPDIYLRIQFKEKTYNIAAYNL